MTTILVTQHYVPDDTSTADYLRTIANAIAQDDDVIVLSGTRGSSSAGHIHGPRVIELSTWTPPKGALLQRGIAMALFAITVFASLLWRSDKSTTIVAVTTPFLLPWVATLAAQIKRAPRVLIVYDIYPDALIAARLVKEGSLLVKLIRGINEWMYRALDAIVIIGRDMEKHFDQYRAPTANKLVYIPNWATLPAGLRPIDPANHFRQEFNQRLLVGLSGNLGFTHDPETVFAAARELVDEAGIGFLLSGWGVGWTRLKSLQENAKLPNVHLIERVAVEELDAFLASADCWLIPYRKGMAGISVPSRLYNLLAIGRPIIVLSEPDAEYAQMLSEHDVGWVVPPEDPAALARVIHAAATNPAAVAAKAYRAVDVMSTRFTREGGSRAYRALIKRLREAGGPAAAS